jgi:uncharacterized protein YbjQ (UPF0145 family)
MPLRPHNRSLRTQARQIILLTSTLVVCGCGSSTTTTADGKSAAQATGVAVVGSDEDVSAAKNVVGQFLDAVRRGGETGGANQLLTQQAQSVLQRLGRTVQPIGSPDAVFQVTRAESVPETPGAALVHSLWTEPSAQGQPESYEVVWALMKETSGWRISGLAMDLQPGQEPIIVDFENAGQMANLLNSNDEAVATNPQGVDTVSQAPPDATQIQR